MLIEKITPGQRVWWEPKPTWRAALIPAIVIQVSRARVALKTAGGERRVLASSLSMRIVHVRTVDGPET